MECVVWPLPRIAEKSHLSVVIGLETILLSPASKEMMMWIFDLKLGTALSALSRSILKMVPSKKNHSRNDIVGPYVALLPTQALHANNIYPTKNDWVEIMLLCRAVSFIGEKHVFWSAQVKKSLEARTATQGYRCSILFNASPPKTQSPITRIAKTSPTKTQMSIIQVAKLQHWTQKHGSRWSENWHYNVHRYQFFK